MRSTQFTEHHATKTKVHSFWHFTTSGSKLVWPKVPRVRTFLQSYVLWKTGTLFNHSNNNPVMNSKFANQSFHVWQSKSFGPRGTDLSVSKHCVQAFAISCPPRKVVDVNNHRLQTSSQVLENQEWFGKCSSQKSRKKSLVKNQFIFSFQKNQPLSAQC
jgi:hypothetical protein